MPELIKRPVHLVVAALAMVFFSATSTAADYEAEAVGRPAPQEELSTEIAESLQTTGVAVKAGDRTICEIWLRKKWDVQPDFQPTFQLLYPFKEGELIGVIRFPRRAYDFRDQEIRRGVYTLRYALQPVDGSHVGTSPTRDFLLLLPVEEDKSLDPIDAEQLVDLSLEASQTGHPALLSFVPAEEAVGDLPAIRHDASLDWWIVQLAGRTGEGEEDQLRVDLVVEGHGPE